VCVCQSLLLFAHHHLRLSHQPVAVAFGTVQMF
jgi:hypothetical protein